jgi:hypothetical protein
MINHSVAVRLTQTVLSQQRSSVSSEVDTYTFRRLEVLILIVLHVIVLRNNMYIMFHVIVLRNNMYIMFHVIVLRNNMYIMFHVIVLRNNMYIMFQDDVPIKPRSSRIDCPIHNPSNVLVDAAQRLMDCLFPRFPPI